MGDPRWKFKVFDQRNDIGDIKSKCYQKSTGATDGWELSQSEYQEEYIRWPLGRTIPAKSPPESVHIGTGNLAPVGDELKTHYQQTYVRHPNLSQGAAKHLPDSELFCYGYGFPKSTTQEANDIVVNNLPTYDNSEAKIRRAEGLGTHFIFGEDAPDYATNYGEFYTGKRGDPAKPALDTASYKSHIEFDHDAGYGPHTKQARHREKVPQKPDSAPRDLYCTNFELGHIPPSYSTTYGSTHGVQTGFVAPERMPAPKMAVLSDHNPYAPPWDSTYKQDFRKLPRIPNDFDRSDLQRSHFDQGHDEEDWSRRTLATTSRKPEKQHLDMQGSNEVFRGDGDMEFRTTSKDLVGVYDKTQDGRGQQVADARADHMFLGADRTPYETTLDDANRCAGTGEPAEKAHQQHSYGFARGGLWEPLIGKDLVSQKKWKPVEQPKGPDKRWLWGTHFDLEATEKNKGRYKTEYFEAICRPKILEDRKKTSRKHGQN
jgi:hypothetical protein